MDTHRENQRFNRFRSFVLPSTRFSTSLGPIRIESFLDVDYSLASQILTENELLSCFFFFFIVFRFRFVDVFHGCVSFFSLFSSLWESNSNWMKNRILPLQSDIVCLACKITIYHHDEQPMSLVFLAVVSNDFLSFFFKENSKYIQSLFLDIEEKSKACWLSLKSHPSLEIHHAERQCFRTIDTCTAQSCER